MMMHKGFEMVALEVQQNKEMEEDYVRKII